ncbi:MarR family winged helix-turn-helix transcriptional regulator [Amycolatopsis acidiphila]|uniref:MarR family winged helix-turn-helix transcriptional regulator n=1 Tax=Amycolatopsis acidiphila TaxID=715473 RepID=UPI001E324254|nr:MarR family winged helix-turn-helix transcriptional regulator [Amycolatopsis acidiphila]UIJ60890.1 MarR family winged helix-turn-helix transcriptional regulator [Amycolatopsis acidiphila]
MTQPPATSPAMLLVLLGRRLRERMDAELREQGLSLRHMSALGHLAGGPGLSYSELARRARITVQSMQSTLAQLEAMGAIERRTEPGRGRTAELHVTGTGAALLAKGREIVRATDEQLVSALGEDEHALTTMLLRALSASAGPAAP